MNIKPSENINLYGLKNYFDEIIKLYNQKKMPNKIILSGKKGLGKSTLAHHIINYILSKNEDYKYDAINSIINKDNRSFILLNNKTHPNFYSIDLINEKKIIDVGQIREMITYTNKSSFNDDSRFILIDNIENLNKYSIITKRQYFFYSYTQ
jgi:DNA polymerase-3 subunit delta'